MKAIVCLFALALLTSSYAFTTRRTMSSILAEVRSLMDTEGPASDVYELIDGLKQDVTNEQAKHDALIHKQREQCNKEFEFRNGEIAEANDAFDRAADHEKKCTTSRERDTAKIESILKDQESTRDSLAKAKAKREKEAGAYQVRTNQHSEAIQAISDAEAYLDELEASGGNPVASTSFAQRLVKSAVQTRKTSTFAPLITAFTQLAASEDPTFHNKGVVERVRELFENVRAEVNDAFAKYTKQEEDAIAAYKALKARLEAQLRQLEADENTVRQHKAEMELCIQQEQQVQTDAIKKRDRNTGLLNDATSLCHNQEESYEKATAARKDEVKVLNDLRNIVAKRYAQFRGSAATRADVDEFRAHENQSEYVKEDYTKEGGEFNAQGAELAGYERNEELERFL